MKPRKGKAKVHTYRDPKTGRFKKVSYGAKGAKVGPKGSARANAYCARSLGIKKKLSKSKQRNPNTPNNLSRRRWGCKGAKSRK